MGKSGGQSGGGRAAGQKGRESQKDGRGRTCLKDLFGSWKQL